MDRKRFMTIGGSLFIAAASGMLLSNVGKTNEDVQDNYYGHSKRIKEAMKSGVIPADFPNSNTYKTKAAFKKAVKKWVVENHQSIKNESLLVFKAKHKIS